MTSEPDLIWINAHVEEMRERDEYTSIPRAEWEAKTESEQIQFMDEMAMSAMNNAGGCGASVVDESEVPEEWREL